MKKYAVKLLRPLIISTAYIGFAILAHIASLKYLTERTIDTLPVSTWYAVPALGLALLLCFGIRYAPAVAAAFLAISALTRIQEPGPSTDFWSITIIAFSNALGYALSAALTTLFIRKISKRSYFSTAKDLWLFVLISSSVHFSVVAAWVGAYVKAGYANKEDYFAAVLYWAAGDCIGFVALTPFLVLNFVPGILGFIKRSRWTLAQLFSELYQRYRRALFRIAIEILAQSAIVAIAIIILIEQGKSQQQGKTQIFSIFYLSFIPTILVAMRYGIRGAVTANLAIVAGVSYAAVSYGYQVGTPVATFELGQLQVFLVLLSITSLFMGSVVTERKVKALQLEDSERRFRSFMNNSPTVAFMKDTGGKYVYVNRGFEKNKGQSQEQIVGRLDHEVWSPEVAQRMRESDALVLTSGKEVELVEPIPQPDGVHQWLTLKFPMLDANNQRYVGGVAIDITDRKKLEEQLLQSQKMEAVGQLASGIAHDFNNLLTAIFGYLALARKTLEADHPAVRSLERVDEAARQASGVSKSLLTYTRRESTHKEPVQLVKIVAQTDRLMHHILPAQIRLVTDTAQGADIWVNADATQIQQVLMNLVINAKDAMPQGGQLTVGVGLFQPPTLKGQTPEEPMACLSVTDTGTGIPPEVLNRIFEPFFTTKPRGQGTGLGLSIIHGIAREHGGRVEVESTMGKGSTFRVLLPRIAAQAAAPQAPAPRRGQGEVVVLAIEHRLVREIIATRLKGLNYQPVQTGEAEECRRILEEQEGKLRLVVLDAVCRSAEVVAMLGRLKPQGRPVPVILLAEEGEEVDTPAELHTMLVRKPFQVPQLVTQISVALEKTVDGVQRQEAAR